MATFVMRGKQYLTALRAEDKLLVLQTLHWADEVRGATRTALRPCRQRQGAGHSDPADRRSGCAVGSGPVSRHLPGEGAGASADEGRGPGDRGGGGGATGHQRRRPDGTPAGQPRPGPGLPGEGADCAAEEEDRRPQRAPAAGEEEDHRQEGPAEDSPRVGDNPRPPPPPRPPVRVRAGAPGRIVLRFGRGRHHRRAGRHAARDGRGARSRHGTARGIGAAGH
ncbi:hypothetical protein OHA88_03355 [Streptomyces sp. NBC_00353]